MNKRKQTYTKTAIWAILFIITGFTAYVVWFLFSPLPISTMQEVRIPTRASISKTVLLLEEKEIIQSPTLFAMCAKVYARISGKNIYAGYYRYSDKNNHLQLLRSLFSGKQSLTVNISFPEGITLREFASIAKTRAGVDSAEFVQYCFSDSLLKSVQTEKTLEGYLMPDTYNIFWKNDARELVQRLIKEQEKLWSRDFASEAQKQKRTRHEILTLASIIEAEASVDSERKRIAGVYINRLKNKMKLDADPTVQYALCEKKRLFYSDLDTDSPYNTYKYIGLPPGPINSPSAESIEAALFPEEHKFLYFVAKGDGSGEHNFSKNYSQHLQAVAVYKKNKAR